MNLLFIYYKLFNLSSVWEIFLHNIQVAQITSYYKVMLCGIENFAHFLHQFENIDLSNTILNQALTLKRLK